ncbi:hypothetical protein, partial [Microbispora bryophytorum]|uniref:hypothetical protein n=1 Tax=Microbispora bryophytorum TaxID=1460882 RepID=UPI003616E48F
VGVGAHAADEHVLVAEMPVRARLVAALAAYVLSGGPIGLGDDVGPMPGDTRRTARETA